MYNSYDTLGQCQCAASHCSMYSHESLCYCSYCIVQNFNSGKVWRNLTNQACQRVWQAKLWRIKLGFFHTGNINFCGIIMSILVLIHLLARVEKWRAWHLFLLPSLLISYLCAGVSYFWYWPFCEFSIWVTSAFIIG